MRFLKLVVVSCFSLFFTGCSDNTEIVLSNTINADSFTLRVPEGWTLFEDQGYDTYVGRIAGFKDTIYFNQGFFSFAGLDRISENDGTIYFQQLNIDGVPSIIHKERIIQGPHEEVGLTVYLEAGDNVRNKLYAINPRDEDILIRIFKTHKFK